MAATEDDERATAKRPPDVGVIIPLYNAERFIAETIASVRDQTHRDLELVVVDDGSADGSLAAARAAVGDDVRCRVIDQPNRGVATARNVGLAELSARCELVLFLDADDVLAPEMVSVLARELREHPAASMVHCRWRYIAGDGSELDDDPARLLPRWGPYCGWVRELPDSLPTTPFASILCGSGLAPSLALMRRASVVQAGGWDGSLGQPTEDTDLFLRLALIGEVRWSPRTLVSYRIHSAQNTSDQEHLGRQWSRLLGRWREMDHLTGAERAVVLDAWRFRSRRFLLYSALRALPERVRAGETKLGLRFVAGALRRAGASLVIDRASAPKRSAR